MSGSLIALAGLGITLASKERFQIALYVLAMSLCPIFLTAVMIRTDIDGYVSSDEAFRNIFPQCSRGRYDGIGLKANARCIRYFTGQDVAVVDYSSKPFFSPHPIPILDSTDKIIGVLKSQRMTLGVIRKNAYQDIMKHCAGSYHVFLC